MLSESRLSPPRQPWGLISSGHGALDGFLRGGLARGKVHELFAGGGEAKEDGDEASAAGFAAMLALIAQSPGKPLLWLRTDAAQRRIGRLDAAGFAAL
ncbi:MAG: hypothetical protein H7X93_03380, partial [Sphingomonadaceae bacterium]|nr:hypothetical protein [Sphingomonadaceae bacterium]